MCYASADTQAHTHTHARMCTCAHTHTHNTHILVLFDFEDSKLTGLKVDIASLQYYCCGSCDHIYMYQQIKQASLLWQKWYPLNNDYQINVGCTTCRFGFGVPVPNCRSLKHWVHTMAELCNWSHIFATWCDVMQPNDKSVNLL